MWEHKHTGKPVREGGRDARKEKNSPEGSEEGGQEESWKGSQETGKESPVCGQDEGRKAVPALRDREIKVLCSAPLVRHSSYLSSGCGILSHPFFFMAVAAWQKQARYMPIAPPTGPLKKNPHQRDSEGNHLHRAYG